MAEYIDREALIERLKFKRNNDDWNNSKYRGLECAIAQVKKTPAADVVEVKHGRWIMTIYTTTSKRGRVITNTKFACSECGYGNGRKQSSSCPNCGAKMEAE